MNTLQTPTEPVYYVKCRLKGKKTYAFLTPKGGTNHLRIYAAQFTQAKAQALIADNTADNPEWEFIVTQ